jgi:hypothetical protein
MSEVINLRRFRKQKSREDSEKQAEVNRLLHGRTKVERERTETEAGTATRFLDGHRIERESASAQTASADKPDGKDGN